MDVKFNIQDLAELFARKNNISRKEADLFVRTFFDTISTYLLREKIVKIKKSKRKRNYHEYVP